MNNTNYRLPNSRFPAHCPRNNHWLSFWWTRNGFEMSANPRNNKILINWKARFNLLCSSRISLPFIVKEGGVQDYEPPLCLLPAIRVALTQISFDIEIKSTSSSLLFQIDLTNWSLGNPFSTAVSSSTASWWVASAFPTPDGILISKPDWGSLGV